MIELFSVINWLSMLYSLSIIGFKQQILTFAGYINDLDLYFLILNLLIR